MTTTNQTATVAERIKAMKERIAVAALQQRMVVEKRERLMRATTATASALIEKLAVLRGLPVRSKDETYNLPRTVAIYSPAGYGTVAVTGENVWVLVEFTIAVDAETEAAWIEHDDERISPEMALEIATDAVEHHLAVPEVEPLVPGKSDEDEDVPL